MTIKSCHGSVVITRHLTIRSLVQMCWAWHLHPWGKALLHYLVQQRGLTVTAIIPTCRQWGDKTSYLKNVKCSGEHKNKTWLP